MEELLNLSTVDLAHKVLALHIQLEEKSNSISLLQETLNEQREITVRNTRNIKRDMKTRFHEQKEEYEAAVARHQKFINQVIDIHKSLLPHSDLLKSMLLSTIVLCYYDHFCNKCAIIYKFE
jgi:predicted translin family RNA/ssDNA-binding protein